MEGPSTSSDGSPIIGLIILVLPFLLSTVCLWKCCSSKNFSRSASKCASASCKFAAHRNPPENFSDDDARFCCLQCKSFAKGHGARCEKLVFETPGPTPVRLQPSAKKKTSLPPSKLAGDSPERPPSIMPKSTRYKNSGDAALRKRTVATENTNVKPIGVPKDTVKIKAVAVDAGALTVKREIVPKSKDFLPISSADDTTFAPAPAPVRDELAYLSALTPAAKGPSTKGKGPKKKGK